MTAMVRQQFNIEGYWEVVVFYNLNYDLFFVVERELRSIGFSSHGIKVIYDEMRYGNALAVTCSSVYYHKSVILFNSHNSVAEYISSVVHEAEHVKQVMLEAYYVEDKGEPPAYTIGYLVKRMWKVFRIIM